MKPNSIMTNAIFTKFTSYVDKGIRLEFVTGEHNEDLLSAISKLHMQHCNLYVTEGAISPESMELLDESEVQPVKNPKTKSQRLRNVLFLLSQQQGKDTEEFYNETMEKIIEHYKSKLD